MLSESQLLLRVSQKAEVPCNGCTSCCKGDLVILDPDKDDLMQYQWIEYNGMPILDHKENGDCIHLTEKGCGVHANPPDVCQRFDCAVLAALTPSQTREKKIAFYPHMAAVYAAGDLRRETLR